MVVELAVQNRPDIAGLVRERLMPRLDVDDAQSPYSECDSRSRYVPRSSGPRCASVSVIQVEDVRLDHRPRGVPSTWMTPADSAHVPGNPHGRGRPLCLGLPSEGADTHILRLGPPRA